MRKRISYDYSSLVWGSLGPCFSWIQPHGYPYYS